MAYNRDLPVAPMEGDDLIDTGKNWLEFVRILKSTKRQGVEELITTLGDKTDFATAPASHSYHLNVKGGLCQHSLNVYNYASQMNKMVGLGIEEKTIILSTLLHDLCKTHYYTVKAELDKEHKEKTGDWRKRQMYVVEDKIPLGHGEKSVILAQQWGVKLTIEECLAIRWHMGFSDTGVHFRYPSGSPFNEAWSKYPIVQIVAMADQLAVTHEDHVFMKNVKAKNLIKR